MIELTFQTADGPIVIQLCDPVATPGAKWPWAVDVRTDGRVQTLVGEDPLEALEMAVRFTASFLSGRAGLDPAVKPPHHHRAAPRPVARMTEIKAQEP